MFSTSRNWGVALAVASLVVYGGIGSAALGAQASDPQGSPLEHDTGARIASIATLAVGDSEERLPYIIAFEEPALAAYQGEMAGLAAPPRRGEGRGRVDVASPQARGYVRSLEARQRNREAQIERALGRGLQVQRRMQHAFNGIVAELSPTEAVEVAHMPGVRLVEAYMEYETNTDTGPGHIGAPLVWEKGTGLPPGLYPDAGRGRGGQGAQGEGIVFGIIDSGINFGSPSFAEVDALGYRHTNPLGEGNYLGTCAPGGIDEGRCNAKLIGGYDFVCEPPANHCANPASREEPGFGDNNGHGSHVASTAAGNVRVAEFRGVEVALSGVAPRANIVAFDTCYVRISDGQGLCPNVSTLAAVEQAVADGVVDVINYSIGGGTSPWSEAVSMAFLGAVDAGIFVSASAGNSGPGAGTVGHREPWVATTASAQHGRGGFEFILRITGPGTPPADLQTVLLRPGSNGVEHLSDIPGTTPLIVSPDIDGTEDGCSGYPAGLFEGAIAMVRRGGCTFAIKTNAAHAAGAIAVVIANNQAGVTTPSVPGTTIPAFLVFEDDGNAVRDFVAANPDATAAIPYPAFRIPNTPDVLAASSSRGPGGFDLIKPDLTAPGVLVLAADAGDTITGFEELVGLKSGTSMASPHNAGAAGLLRQLHPSWTPAEVKSALVMTADLAVLLEDEATAAHPFARGSGRIQVDRAAKAGLVMDESTANYLAANPANDGEPSGLNLPSLAQSMCIEECVFERTFRNTRRNAQAWSASIQGLTGSVRAHGQHPARPHFLVRAGESLALEIAIDSRSLPADGAWRFGTLVLTPIGGFDQPTLRLPIAVAVPPPSLALDAEQLDLALTAGQSGQVDFTVSNLGGPGLDYAVDESASAPRKVVRIPREGVTSGFRSSFYTDQGIGQYAADDFTLEETLTLGHLVTEGFTLAQPVSTAASITWTLFPDAGGVPAGNPETDPGTAVWRYTAAPNAPGVDTTGNTIRLDLEAAGQSLTLPPGTYWLVVHADTSFADRWVWYAANQASGHPSRAITPSTGTWGATGAFPSLAFEVDGQVQCGTPWIVSVVPMAGSLGAGEEDRLTVTVDSSGLSAGRHAGYVCVASNDPERPTAAVRVVVDVSAP